MQLIVLKILISPVLGTLIDLTGMGRGFVLLPVFIFCLSVAPKT